MKKFWTVWSDNGAAATFKHVELVLARREAERLAQKNPGIKFHVLELVGTCSVPATVWTTPEEDLTQMPF